MGRVARGVAGGAAVFAHSGPDLWEGGVGAVVAVVGRGETVGPEQDPEVQARKAGCSAFECPTSSRSWPKLPHTRQGCGWTGGRSRARFSVQ